MHENELTKYVVKLTALIKQAIEAIEGKAWDKVYPQAALILLLLQQILMHQEDEKLSSECIETLNSYLTKLCKALLKYNELCDIAETRIKILEVLRKFSELKFIDRVFKKTLVEKFNFLNHKSMSKKLRDNPYRHLIPQDDNESKDTVAEIIQQHEYGGTIETLIKESEEGVNPDARLMQSLLILLPYFQYKLIHERYESLDEFIQFVTPLESLLNTQLMPYDFQNMSELEWQALLRYEQSLVIALDRLLGKAFQSESKLNARLEQVKSINNQRLRRCALIVILEQFTKQYKTHPMTGLQLMLAFNGLSVVNEPENIPCNLVADYSNDLKLTRSVFSNHEMSLFEQQAQAIENSQILLNRFLNNAIEVLGEPPCDIGLLFLGSSSRGDRMPHSDVELALLYEPKIIVENNNNNNNPILTTETTPEAQFKCDYYIAHLICLLELQIVYLGESHSEHQGFWLDDSTSIRKLHHLRGNPKWVIQSGILEKENPLNESLSNGYSLELMPAAEHKEKVLYLKNIGGSIEYEIKGEAGKLFHGEIEVTQNFPSNFPKAWEDLNQVKPYLNDMLEVISERGHICKIKKLHSFVYDPSSLSLFKPKLINVEYYNGGKLFDDYMILVNDYLSNQINPRLLSELIVLPEPALELPDTLNNAQSISDPENNDALNLSHSNPVNLLQNKGSNRHWHPVWIAWDVMRHAPDWLDTENNTVDLKKAVYKPLAYLGLALKLYFELEVDDLEQAFSNAVQKQLLSPEVGRWCIQTLEWITALRIKLHLKENKQVETFSLESLTEVEQARLARLSSHIKLFENGLRQYLQDCLHHPGKPFVLDEILSRYFIESLIACQQKEDYIEWFNGLTGFLLDTKQPLVVHRHYYRQLPNEYRHICLKAAKKAFNQKDSLWGQESYFWEQVFDAPDEQGERLSYGDKLEQWQTSLKSLLVDKSAIENETTQVYIKGLISGEGALSPQMVGELIKYGWIVNSRLGNKAEKFVLKEEHPIAQHMPGNHLVIPWPLPKSLDEYKTEEYRNSIQYYLKIFPEYPLIELFLHDLGRRLGAYIPRFVDVWRWQCGKYDYPILVTEAVPGQSLQEVFDASKQLNLNLQAFNESVVLSALTQLEDNKPDNLIVKHTAQGEQIVLIDADRWFVPPFKDNKLHAKDITFCLEDMYKKIDWVWREEFLSLNPQNLLSAWVGFMTVQAAQCIDIFGSKINDYCSRRLNNRQERKSTVLPPLKTNVVMQLHSDIQSLQSEVSQRPNVNLFKLVSRIQPRIANHYGLSHEQKLGTPLNRFEYVAGHAYTRGKGGKECYTSNINFKTQQQDMWQGLSASSNMIENWERDIGLIQKEIISLSEKPAQLKQAIVGLTQNNIQPFKNLTQRGKEKALHQFNEWHRLNDEAYQALMTALKLTPNWQHLTFKDNARLTESDCSSLLNNSPNVLTLTLENCPKITGNALQAYCVEDCSLKVLRLIKLDNLKAFGRLRRFTSEKRLFLPNLEKLLVQDCDNLQSVNIQASLLSVIQIDNVPQLSICRARSKFLSGVSMKNCDSLSSSELCYLSQGNETRLPIHFTGANFKQDSSAWLDLLNTHPFLFDLKLEEYKSLYPKHLKALRTLLSEQALSIKNALSSNQSQVYTLLLDVLEEIKTLEAPARNQILPALLKAIKDKDKIARENACQQLGWLGIADNKVVEALLAGTKDTAGGGREACWALGQLGVGEPEVIDALLEKIEDKNKYIRSEVCQVLGQLGTADEKVIVALLDLIKDEEQEVRSAACRALGQLGVADEKVIDALLALMKDEEDDGDRDVQSAACWALGQLGVADEKVIDALLALMEDNRASVRSAAGQALRQLGAGEPRALNALSLAIKDWNEDVRIAACVTLGRLRIADTQVIDALLEKIEDKNKYIRSEVCQALGQLGTADEKVIVASLALMKDKETDVRSAACRALGRLGMADDNVMEALLEAIKDKEGVVRSEACEALGQLGMVDDNVMEALLEAIKDKKGVVRSGACEALGRLGVADTQVIDALLEVRKDKNRNMRIGACRALGRLGACEPKVIAVLLRGIKEWDGGVRIAACQALGQSGVREPQVIDALLEAIKEKVPGSMFWVKSEYGGVGAAACRALGQLGVTDSRVIAALLASIKDKNETVRGYACKVLGIFIQTQFETILKNFKQDLEKLSAAEVLADSVENNVSGAGLFSPTVQKKQVTLPGWEIENVPGDGNCFYHVLAAQLELIKHERLKEIKKGTAPHDALRLDIQQHAFSDSEWTGDEDFEAVVRQYNIVLAIADTRNPAAGFTCHFVDDDGNYGTDTTGEFELLDRPVIKMAYTGNHFMSVVLHPALEAGAYRLSSNEVNKSPSTVLN